MAESLEDMNEKSQSATTEADFNRWAGISPELARFVNELIERPEILFSMPIEKRHEIEAQMDAVLGRLGRS